MFATPEYASYVQLCRELRLEREFDDGDYYTAPVPVSVIAPEGFEVLIWVGLFRLPHATEDCIWLPRLDQWLATLEEAGVKALAFIGIPGEEGWICQPYTEPHEGRGPTREEACARLWMAVTGRAVTA